MNDSQNQSDTGQGNWVSQNAGVIQFFIVTLGIFGVLYLLYQQVLVGSDMFRTYIEFCGALASELLKLAGFDNTIVHAAPKDELGSILQSPVGASFLINQNSDASMSFFLLIAGILAWPGGWLKKLMVLVAGIAFVFLLNVARLAGMLVVDIYRPLQFDLFNTTVLPLVMIVAAIAYFLFWVKISGAHPADQ